MIILKKKTIEKCTGILFGVYLFLGCGGGGYDKELKCREIPTVMNETSVQENSFVRRYRNEWDEQELKYILSYESDSEQAGKIEYLYNSKIDFIDEYDTFGLIKYSEKVDYNEGFMVITTNQFNESGLIESTLTEYVDAVPVKESIVWTDLDEKGRRTHGLYSFVEDEEIFCEDIQIEINYDDSNREITYLYYVDTESSIFFNHPWCNREITTHVNEFLFGSIYKFKV